MPPKRHEDLSHTDELELFRMVANTRDADALGELFQRYAARFIAALRRRGFSPTDAEDIVQTCFLKIIGAGSALHNVTAPGGYLWRTLLNAASDHVGNNRRFVALEPCNSDEQASISILERLSTTDTTEARLDIDRCVYTAWERLLATAPDRAQALEWAIIDELSGQEIAQLLNRSYGATREFLSQCRRVLRTLISDVCPDWTEESP
jgi:RNA polymerase sigma factor (sigma-70 family)